MSGEVLGVGEVASGKLLGVCAGALDEALVGEVAFVEDAGVGLVAW